MTKKMTEAARLYLKDIDVLEEARLDLVEFLEAVWESWASSLEGCWNEVQSQWGEVVYYQWKENQPGKKGTWHTGIEKAICGFAITLMDPRRTEREPTKLHLLLQTSKANLSRLRKRPDSAIERLTTAARDQDIDLRWDDPDELWSDSIEIEPDSAETTGERLADLTREYLEHILRFDQVLDGEKVEEPGTT